MGTVHRRTVAGLLPECRGQSRPSAYRQERILRIFFLQQSYALADEALEDAIHDSQAMRDFVGIDLAIENVPGATTLLRFLHLLEKHALTQRIEEINAYLAEKGLFISEDTIVAAAPCDRHRMKPIIARRKMKRKLRPDAMRGFHKSRYRDRNIVERYFGWMKELRWACTRYNKLASSFRAMVCLACIDRCLRADFSNKA